MFDRQEHCVNMCREMHLFVVIKHQKFNTHTSACLFVSDKDRSAVVDKQRDALAVDHRSRDATLIT